jgi:hypothetical protein
MPSDQPKNVTSTLGASLYFQPSLINHHNWHMFGTRTCIMQHEEKAIELKCNI